MIIVHLIGILFIKDYVNANEYNHILILIGGTDEKVERKKQKHKRSINY